MTLDKHLVFTFCLQCFLINVYYFIVIRNMPYYPITLILITNKLTRPTDVGWIKKEKKREKDLVITQGKLKWVTRRHGYSKNHKLPVGPL